MTIAKKIYEQLSEHHFSYGDTLSMILDNSGKPISNLPNEDFLFSDNSVLRVTNTGVKLLEMLNE